MTATVPDAITIRAALREAYSQFKDVTDGQNASYIPYLANVQPSLFGLAVTTVDGQIFETGDTRYEFAIESISKVFEPRLAPILPGCPSTLLSLLNCMTVNRLPLW
jgi:glutaminase